MAHSLERSPRRRLRGRCGGWPRTPGGCHAFVEHGQTHELFAPLGGLRSLGENSELGRSFQITGGKNVA